VGIHNAFKPGLVHHSIMEFKRRKGQLFLPNSLEYVLPEVIVPEGLEGRLGDAKPVGTAGFYRKTNGMAKVLMCTDHRRRYPIGTNVVAQPEFLYTVLEYLRHNNYALKDWKWQEGYTWSSVEYSLTGTLLKVPK
jgi:hypothetical protein